VVIHARGIVLSLAAWTRRTPTLHDYSVERVGRVVLQLRDTVWSAIVFDSAVMGSRCLEGLENHEIHTTF